MKLGLLIITTSVLITFSYGQDTVHVEPSISYSSQLEPMRGKNFTSRVKYAREDIIFTERHKRVEYCFYYDKERICHGDTYQLIGDSILQIGESTAPDAIQTWAYRKIEENQYLIYRFNNGLYETCHAKALIPLQVIGSLYTMPPDKSDTLWIADYSSVDANNPYSKPKYSYPKTSIKGKIYDQDKVDQPPMLSIGEFLPETIERERVDGCYGEPYLRVLTITFVVTSDGSIKNIEQGFGNFDMEYCPHYILELMATISQFGKLIPATRKGKSVNVRYTINIDMKGS